MKVITLNKESATTAFSETITKDFVIQPGGKIRLSNVIIVKADEGVSWFAYVIPAGTGLHFDAIRFSDSIQIEIINISGYKILLEEGDKIIGNIKINKKTMEEVDL